MSDEKKIPIPKIHGFEIDTQGHHDAAHFMEKHMSKEQVHEMIHNIKINGDHDKNSHFMARNSNGHDVEYKIEHHSDGFKLAKVHHSF